MYIDIIVVIIGIPPSEGTTHHTASLPLNEIRREFAVKLTRSSAVTSRSRSVKLRRYQTTRRYTNTTLSNTTDASKVLVFRNALRRYGSHQLYIVSREEPPRIKTTKYTNQSCLWSTTHTLGNNQDMFSNWEHQLGGRLVSLLCHLILEVYNTSIVLTE